MLNGNPVSDENVAKVLMSSRTHLQGLAQEAQGLRAQEIDIDPSSVRLSAHPLTTGIHLSPLATRF